VVACLRLVIDGKVVKEVRTFSTTTAGLMALSEWLAENKCTHIAMEATGVYWKPVWHVLSDGYFELELANAAHVKNVPGRKTGVKDADWVADLLAHGLIPPSFVPDSQTQEVRTLLRTRKQLVREKSSHILQIQKTLEDANIKLDPVITDVMGLSGRKMLEALIAGERSPSKLARLADRRVRASQGTLREALRGRMKEHHRFSYAFISIRSMLLTPPSPRSTRKWRPASPLSHRRRTSSLDPGREESRCANDHLRDRHRHEPLCHRCQSHLLGLHLPAQRRECRQAPIEPHSQGLTLAQDHIGAVRMGGGAH
jgi:Transposase